MKWTSTICSNGVFEQVFDLGSRGGGGQVISVLTLYSNDPSSNPAEIYKIVVEKKRTKINK